MQGLPTSRWASPRVFPPFRFVGTIPKPLMARRESRSTRCPLPLRFLLRLYEALASLRLAVVVIFASALVLGWATYVESKFGTEAVHAAVYGSWWFAALVGLLGVNVLCAALIRFPWKRRQTGFLVTHAGILLLLVGCLVSSIGGLEALLWVFEEGSEHLAFQDTQHFELKILPQSPGHTPRDTSEGNAGAAAGTGDTIEIPFVPGPFNWADYRELAWFPWHLCRRDRGVLYDRDGVKLEVVDYYSDSELEPGAPLELRVKGPSDDWRSIRIEAGDAGRPSPHGTTGTRSRQALPGGQWVVFWVAESPAETAAFRNSRPGGPLGALGQVVLYAAGESHRFSVEDLKQQKRVPLGATGMEVEFVKFDPTFRSVVLEIHHPDGTQHRMTLYADIPDPQLARHDREYGVFGSYWFDLANAPPSGQGAAVDLDKLRRPRIDIVQGTDGELYYRAWSSPELETIDRLPADGTRVVAFEKSDSPVTFYVEGFTPHDRPGWNLSPAPFDKEKEAQQKVRQARVRLTVDGNSEEFWLEGMRADPVDSDPKTGQRRVVAGKGRRVAITLPWDRLDLGFALYLHKFERKLDPGTSMPSYYASLVDMLAPGDKGDSEPLRKNVLITLNEPGDFSDPSSGRSYRVYQSSFDGPFRPGHPFFDDRVGGTGSREELYISVLSVNYDPGRGLKYSGCLLICAGVATMFYMRAYFFKRRPSRAEEGS
jgi:hypothetical protein